MTFQRTIVGLLTLVIAGLAAAFYMNWKTATQLRTVKAFVEGYVFAEAVAACEKAPSTTPFKWNTGTKTSVIGIEFPRAGLIRTTVISGFLPDDGARRTACHASSFDPVRLTG
jgi:hypothetical protein